VCQNASAVGFDDDGVLKHCRQATVIGRNRPAIVIAHHQICAADAHDRLYRKHVAQLHCWRVVSRLDIALQISHCMQHNRRLYI
jgi:hypothetical protein